MGSKMRRCASCHTSQDPSEFYACGHGRHRGVCKTCIEDQRRWVLYGVLPWDYWNAFYCMGGRCAICNHPPDNGERLVVDHNHRTGDVRGLLCKPCNLAIGLMKDKVDRLLCAAAYLEECE